MGLFNKISCEIQILNEKVGKLMIENGKLKEELQQEIRAKESWRDLYREQLEKNKNLKEKLSKITMVADDEKQSIEHILELEEENQTLKDNVEFLHSCLDDRDKSIELQKEEIKGLRDKQYTHGEPVVSSGPCL